MTPSLRRLLLCLCCLSLLAGACGDDGDDADDREDAADVDDGDDDADDDDAGGDGACALLDDDAVEALLGQDVEDPVQEDLDETATSCTWSTEAPSAVVDGPITLTVERGELTDEVDGQIDDALAADGNQPQDLGDRAVLVCGLGADGGDCDQFDSVAVAVGDTYLEVDLGNWGYPDDFSEEEGVQIMLDAATQAADALG